MRVSMWNRGARGGTYLPSGLRARRSSKASTSGGAAPGWRLPAPPRPEEWKGPTDAERERERLLERETAALPAPPRPYVRCMHKVTTRRLSEGYRTYASVDAFLPCSEDHALVVRFSVGLVRGEGRGEGGLAVRGGMMRSAGDGG